jgi:hypothetical protein
MIIHKKDVIMPNHLHMIVRVNNVGTPYMASGGGTTGCAASGGGTTGCAASGVGTTGCAASGVGTTGCAASGVRTTGCDERTPYMASLPIKSKQTVSKAIQQYKASVTRDTAISELWQPRFHDRIIRNEDEYWKIWKYIDENPLNWENDEYR